MIYTKEMKQAIESHGMMVIEFKKKVRDGIIIITQVANKIVAIMNRFLGSLLDLEHVLAGKSRDLIDFFKSIADFDFHLPPWMFDIEKFTFVRKIDNGYRLFIKRPIVKHCRNTC